MKRVLRSLFTIIPPLQRIIPLLAALGISTSPQVAYGLNDTHLPDIGNRDSILIDPITEKALGQQWLRTFRGRAPISEDPLLNDYMKHLVYSLVPHSELTTTDLSIVVIDNPEINAFAVPGGIMGFNTGLILAANQEDEVASVIAHELAHLSQQHFLRRFASIKRAQTLNLAGILGALGLALAGAPADASLAAIAASQAATIDSILRHSRAHEQEADRIGMSTLVRSNRDPRAMPAFFQKLHEKYRFSSRPPEFLLTHPVTEKRVSDATNRLRSLKPNIHSNQNHSTMQFELIQMRLKTRTSRNPAMLANQLSRQRMSNPKEKANKILRYGIGAAWLESRKPDKALPYLSALASETPSNIAFQYTLGEAYLSSNKLDKAIEVTQEALALNPANFAITTLLARIHLKADHPQQALALLTPYARQQTDLSPGTWYYLAEAAGKLGQTVDVHRYNAERLFALGQYQAALQQLHLALPLSKSQQIKAKIKARQATYKQAMEPVKF